MDHIARQEADKELIEARKKFVDLIKQPGGLEPFADLNKETAPEIVHIKLVLNDYEVIAIGIELGIIDFELYKRWFRAGVVSTWNHSQPFVYKLRARTGNEMLFHEFETMAGWFKGGGKPKRGYKLSQWFK